jgi:hypothetical protein
MTISTSVLARSRDRMHAPRGRIHRVRVRPTSFTDKLDRRNQELAPGAILTREWNGRDHRVMVLADGFAFEGKTYDSLSKIAFAITGTKWNGPRFFGLRAATQSAGPQ